jgi:predicted RNA-binding Zn-ribbon protein involved in translation (DUF1610 family)
MKCPKCGEEMVERTVHVSMMWLQLCPKCDKEVLKVWDSQ